MKGRESKEADGKADKDPIFDELEDYLEDVYHEDTEARSSRRRCPDV